jgi:hypothetical protein
MMKKSKPSSGSLNQDESMAVGGLSHLLLKKVTTITIDFRIHLQQRSTRQYRVLVFGLGLLIIYTQSHPPIFKLF